MPIRPKISKPEEPQRFPGDKGKKYDMPLGNLSFPEQAMEAFGEHTPMRQVEPPARPSMPYLEQYDDRDMMRRSTQGSRPFTKSELRRGYRRM